jgi:HK97 gp10 family phage protein
MPDGLEITFEGMPEFSRMMQELAGPAAERIARHAVRAGGRVVQAAITEAAPVRPDLPSGTALPPGALKNDIEVKTVKESDGSISAYIGPGRETAHAARLVEYGHRQIRGGTSSKGGGILGQSYRGSGKNIGKDVPPHPFIRPAWENAETAAQDAIAMDIAASFSRGYKTVMPEDESGTSPGLLGTGE